MTTHHCHAVGCNTVVPPKLLMCPRHWRLVPGALQAAVWKTYAPGQEIRKDPTDAYIHAAKAAIAFVYKHEIASGCIKPLGHTPFAPPYHDGQNPEDLRK